MARVGVRSFCKRDSGGSTPLIGSLPLPTLYGYVVTEAGGIQLGQYSTVMLGFDSPSLWGGVTPCQAGLAHLVERHSSKV